MSTATATMDRTDVRENQKDDDPIVTHLVDGDAKHTGVELVMKARIEGTPVTALCGYTWVPSKDPEAGTLCSKCRDIYDEVSERTGQHGRDPWDVPSS